MTEFEIRPVRPLEDASAVLDHVRAVCGEPGVWVVTTADEFQVTVDEEVALLRDLSDHPTSACWIGLDATQRLAGMLMARGGDRQRNQHVSSLGMSVSAAHRGQGLGRQLLVTCLDWAREHELVRRVELNVIADNAPAVHLYRSLGFEVEGVQRGIYQRNGRLHDQYVMAVLLS
ncbi:MAG: GNAT family N-acetyltransferase [Planctomycetota bacterium]|nr:GNAT family N-acetyltransferase [Planctomycetota bacterium]